MSILVTYNTTTRLYGAYDTYDEFMRDVAENEYDRMQSIIITLPEREIDFQKFLPPLGTYFPNTKVLTIRYPYQTYNNDERHTLELPKVHRNTSNLTTYGITISNIEDILPVELEILELRNGEYKVIPTLPQNIIKINMSNNQINVIPDQFPETLEGLVLSQNRIEEICTLPPRLLYLYIDHNNIHYLPELPSTITDLYIESNTLYQLPILPDSLIELNCEDNCIAHFPNNFPDEIVLLRTRNNPGSPLTASLERLEHLERSS